MINFRDARYSLVVILGNSCMMCLQEWFNNVLQMQGCHAVDYITSEPNEITLTHLLTVPGMVAIKFRLPSG